MVQALTYTGWHLAARPHHVQNTYTELRKGSKKAVIVVQNNTAYPQTLQKKTPMARAVPTLPVPEPPESKSLQSRR